MIMIIPFFLLYGVYGAVGTYHPVLLTLFGYSATVIGIILSVFEFSGMLFPLFISTRVARSGKYGKALVFLALLMIFSFPVLLISHSIPITLLVFVIFSIGFKGCVPVADSLVSQMLSGNSVRYGQIRAFGSLGFVCMTLLFQFTPILNPASSVSIILWTVIPVVLFAISILILPGIQTTQERSPRVTLSEKPVSFRLVFSGALSPSFWIGLSVIFFGFLGLVPSQRFFSLYVRDYLQMESYAGLWALAAAAEIPFMFASGKLIQKFGSLRLLLLSLCAICIRNLVYALFPSFEGAVFAQLLHSICYGVFHPAAVIFITERIPRQYMVVGMTLYTAVAVGSAFILGSAIGGLIIDTLGYRLLFTFFSIFPLIGIGVLFKFLKTLKVKQLSPL